MTILSQEIEKILTSSPTLNCSKNTIYILANLIGDMINANYELKPKKVWYGKNREDLIKRIKQLKQHIAITYNYLKKEDKWAERRLNKLTNSITQLEFRGFKPGSEDNKHK